MISLKDKHSFRISSQAYEYHAIRSLADLELVKWTEDSWILGDGSNTIFTADFAGQVIHNRLLGHHIEEQDDSFAVTIAAGENWHHWVSRLVDEGIYGFENLALIPGSVGAAPVQNIGAYGVEISEFISEVSGIDLATRKPFKLTNKECAFAYRDSLFKRPESRALFITEVSFCLPKAWQPVLEYPDLQQLPATASAAEVMAEVIAVRQAKLPDPAQLPNAGSFFKNPVVDKALLNSLLAQFPQMPYYSLPDGQFKLAAGWLIDQAGLKTARRGGAAVHQRQALVLINQENASGDDVLNLAQHIQQVVKDKFSVDLQPEVRLLGSRGLLPV
ncbi:UDP-N-acetylmuramate dehydrogenase [Aliidiomarina sp. Khilg15.8]